SGDNSISARSSTLPSLSRTALAPSNFVVTPATAGNSLPSIVYVTSDQVPCHFFSSSFASSATAEPASSQMTKYPSRSARTKHLPLRVADRPGAPVRACSTRPQSPRNRARSWPVLVCPRGKIPAAGWFAAPVYPTPAPPSHPWYVSPGCLLYPG